ncbi:lactate utilization protein C [Pseudomonadota bacterium]
MSTISNGARSHIFSRLKATLDAKQNPTMRLSEADQRIKEAPRATIPKRGLSDGIARAQMFADEAERVQTDVVRLDRLDEVPAQVAKIVAGAAVKIAPHDVLEVMDWSGLDVEFGIGAGDDLVGLSMAYAGVAETGTLVMRSGADAPTTLNFLVDTHIVVLRGGDVEANYEEVWSRLRVDGKDNAAVLPRTVNWITGPSRTADIEQTILLGAHGPRKLVILLIDEES